MRGKVTTTCTSASTTGITPAYAGKSVGISHTVAAFRDHPRVCGEKTSLTFTACSPMGSPPRMRGKGQSLPRDHPQSGITPAYAGKSSAVPQMPAAVRDHPRVCGEKVRAGALVCHKPGSPPRMRGKGPWVSVSDVPVGITPAYAGKRLSSLVILMNLRDHPRVCGEKTKKIPSHRPFQLHPVPVSFSFA